MGLNFFLRVRERIVLFCYFIHDWDLTILLISFLNEGWKINHYLKKHQFFAKIYFFCMVFYAKGKRNAALADRVNRCTVAGRIPCTDTQVKFLLAGGASCWRHDINWIFVSVASFLELLALRLFPFSSCPVLGLFRQTSTRMPVIASYQGGTYRWLRLSL